MVQTHLSYLIALVCATAISAFLFVRMWHLRHTPAGPAFIGLMLCAFFYTLGYAFELSCVHLAGMLLWNKVQYLGISYFPVFWILLAARYSGKDAWLTKPVVSVLFLLSTLTLLFNLTNTLHRLFYGGTSLDVSGPYPALVIQGGPWYWVHIGYSNLALLVGNLLLIATFRHARRTYRRQASIMVIGSVIPWLALFIYLLGLSPHHLDTTPLALMITGVILASALFRYRGGEDRRPSSLGRSGDV